ncbi:hypothetical protein [Fodinicurvata sp. EGI_FJ10296]|uniref:hypothetical protein n=1 Tax=Fodinicurvata sp. EGI_FJ10296 TaxID=3231908 RepID=UPI00345146DE
MSSAMSRPRWQIRNLAPGSWSLSQYYLFFRVAPKKFLTISFLETMNRFILMALFLIPIRLLFLASSPDPTVTIPFLEIQHTVGQIEVTILSIPVGLLALLSLKVKDFASAYLATLDTAYDLPGPNAKSAKSLKVVVKKVSALTDGLVLAVATTVVMAVLLPFETAIILTVLIACLMLLRYRVKRSLLDVAETETNTDTDDTTIENNPEHSTKSTDALTQIVMMPVFIYLLSGAIISGAIGPLLGLAYLLLFRIFMGARKSIFVNIVQLTSALRSNPVLVNLMAPTHKTTKAKS